MPSCPLPIWSAQDIAAFIKKEFDKKHNPTWHCIVGRNFGSYVTHETKHFIYFYLGQASPKSMAIVKTPRAEQSPRLAGGEVPIENLCDAGGGRLYE